MDAIVDPLTCAICSDLFNKAVVTSCGHTFCEACIHECLNLKHVCPLCNKDGITVDKLVRNLALDGVIESVREASASADEQYTSDLFVRARNNMNMNTETTATTGATNSTLPTLEATFASYMSETLLAFRNHQANLDAMHRRRLAQLQIACASDPQFVFKQSELEKRHERASALMIEELCCYLGQTAVPPFLVPTTVTVVFRGGSKGARQREIRFDANLTGATTAADIWDLVREAVVSRGDEIIKTNSLRVVLHRRRRGHEGHPAGDDHHTDAAGDDHHTDADQDVALGLDSPMPLFSAVPEKRLDGARWMVYVEGESLLKSDTEPCFSRVFKKDTGQKTNYYSCLTCGIKWICPRCASTCHTAQGHEVVMYLKGHTPTWACCYCARKKPQTKCRLCG